MGEFTKDKLDDLVLYCKYILTVLINGTYTFEAVLLTVIYFSQYLTYVYSEEKVKVKDRFITGVGSVYKLAPYKYYCQIVKLRNELVHFNNIKEALEHCDSIMQSLEEDCKVNNSFEQEVLDFIGISGFRQIKDFLIEFNESKKESPFPAINGLIKGE